MEEERSQPASETIVGADVKIKGNLKSPSNIQIFGKVNGQVSSEADVLIGEGACIEGGVKGRKITISGEVLGNIQASESLEITSQGKLQGDIEAPDLVIQSGAKFVGKCEMPVESQASSEEEREEPVEKKDEALEELEETIQE